MPRKHLAQLADTGAPTGEALTALSGMDARALHDFQLIWANTGVARRCEILLALQPLLEANATLDFSAVATAALADPDGDVRAAAVPLLFDDVDPKPVILLLDLMQSDPHAPCRAAAARGIALASTVGGGYGRDVAVLAEAHVRAILTLGQAYQEARFTGAVALP